MTRKAVDREIRRIHVVVSEPGDGIARRNHTTLWLSLRGTGEMIRLRMKRKSGQSRGELTLTTMPFNSRSPDIGFEAILPVLGSLTPAGLIRKLEEKYFDSYNFGPGPVGSRFWNVLVLWYLERKGYLETSSAAIIHRDISYLFKPGRPREPLPIQPGTFWPQDTQEYMEDLWKLLRAQVADRRDRTTSTHRHDELSAQYEALRVTLLQMSDVFRQRMLNNTARYG